MGKSKKIEVEVTHDERDDGPTDVYEELKPIKSVEEYQRDVEKALKEAGTMCPALKMQARSLASALRTVDLANREIDTLDCTTVWEETRYGKKLAPHPAFKTLRDAQDSVTRQLKILGLTVEDLAGDSEADPLIDMTSKLLKTSRKAAIHKPRAVQHLLEL